jgi:putative hemolysin
MTLATELLVILLLILANGLFAGAEIAIISVRKTRVRELCGEGLGSARALERLREAPESFFATVQVGSPSSVRQPLRSAARGSLES